MKGFRADKSKNKPQVQKNEDDTSHLPPEDRRDEVKICKEIHIFTHGLCVFVELCSYVLRTFYFERFFFLLSVKQGEEKVEEINKFLKAHELKFLSHTRNEISCDRSQS